jgi:O-antigen ligase
MLGVLILIVSQFLFIRLGSESLTTLENRTNIWDVVYNYIINGDIIKGNGFGSLSELSKIDEFLGAPHSYYLQTILETGIIGVVIVIWLFLRTMSLQWRNIAECADDVTAKNMTMICFFAASLMFLNSFTEVIISSMNASFAYWVLFALPTAKHGDQTR